MEIATIGLDIAKNVAEGVVLNYGRRIGPAEGWIKDHKGRLLAHGTATCLIFQS
jgi:acyl-coenzyme A thioesterase PaaI-like protein